MSGMDADSFKKELVARVNAQVSDLKTKLPAGKTTSRDIEDEIFGGCDHLEMMLNEVEIPEDFPVDDFLGKLPGVQQKAFLELCDHFEC